MLGSILILLSHSFFEEVKAQILQGKNEEEETEWQQAVMAECSEVNGFHLPMVISDAESISQKDLLLLSTKKFGEGKQLPATYAFALVEHCQQDKIKLRLYLSGEIRGFDTDDVQTSPRLLSMLAVVSVVKKHFYVLKLINYSS